jgi:hypothetical protein
MLAGNVDQRAPGGVTKWNAICFRCYNLAPCSDSTVDSVSLPANTCGGGIRTTIRFPTYVFLTCPALLNPVRIVEYRHFRFQLLGWQEPR